jgi:hypothetical protein
MRGQILEYYSVNHKVCISLEYHSVCPLVRIGTPHPLSNWDPPPPLELGPPSHPLSRKRVRHSPGTRGAGGGGTHLLAGEGVGASQFERLEKKPSTLSTLCFKCTISRILLTVCAYLRG